eukprot:TRINITY_DN3103_c0_g1_i1.p1 TRINITY_DN3103_c0_g1~~TRINITY_DN3103_c0_g1_i1.p1  ORF type:complete len:464 (+),score=58.53 TRINITY_DN3103_c0_g1_i1:40-1392(+)
MKNENPDKEQNDPENQQEKQITSMRKEWHNSAVHTHVKPSPLTSSYSEQNFRGFFNFASIILFVSNFNLVAENLIKYGVLFSFSSIANYFDIKAVALCLAMNIHVLAQFGMEVLVLRRRVTEVGLRNLFVGNMIVLLVAPSVYVYQARLPVFTGVMVLATAVILWMKLISYHLVNRDFRRVKRRNREQKACEPNISHEADIEVDTLEYPDNITLSNLYHFIILPVLVYQINYPRTKKIRWYWLSGKLFQFGFLSILMLVGLEQWVVPTAMGSVKYFQSFDLVRVFLRCLKLSIPASILWVSGFYNIFHLWLNILAELTRFGDREFYKDWWNSTTLSEYWRLWNTPVHHWLRRHIYYPSLRRGISKTQASIIIFAISAFFHEYLASIPMGMIRPYFFFGMLGQVPTMIFTEKYFKNTTTGNFIFWFFFCILGQPMGLLLYFHDYTYAHSHQ